MYLGNNLSSVTNALKYQVARRSVGLLAQLSTYASAHRLANLLRLAEWVAPDEETVEAVENFRREVLAEGAASVIIGGPRSSIGGNGIVTLVGLGEGEGAPIFLS